eukprot:6369913-Prymnesium_polylepis.1
MARVRRATRAPTTAAFRPTAGAPAAASIASLGESAVMRARARALPITERSRSGRCRASTCWMARASLESKKQSSPVPVSSKKHSSRCSSASKTAHRTAEATRSPPTSTQNLPTW